MTVGYLQLGPPESGPGRFGRMLAGYVRAHTNWDTTERVVSPGSVRPRWRDLAAAGAGLSNADAVHVQYAPKIWGGGWRQVPAVRSFCRRLRAPLLVTVHDLVAAAPPLARAALHQLAREAGLFVVGGEAERDRLDRLGTGVEIAVVQHYVEQRPSLVPREAARRALGLEGRRIVTLLGYIHPRKGHDLALDALALTPADTFLVFAGGATRHGEAYVARIREHAERTGVADRLRVTGYLSDRDLDLYLSATDIGVLPFRGAAASGSLATWLAAARPLVGTEIPLLREYAPELPTLLRLVPPEDPAALADAWQAVEPSEAHAREAAAVAARCSPARTAERFTALYRRLRR